MSQSWARAYAERWGLPEDARAELEAAFAAQRDPFAVRAAEAPTIPGAPPELPMETMYPGTLMSGAAPPSDGADLGMTVPVGIRAAPIEERYEDVGLISMGGMGEVRRVWDRALNRTVAMKVLRRDLAERDDLVLRFIEEAEATGQLEHPGVVPIYDIGRLPDGRPYFTMKEIRARTMLDVIEELHQASPDTWRETETGWSFTKLVTAFRAVCDAVSYAHSRGVLHRDLKPTNVMLGEFGEVVVMDWGLAKVAGVPDLRAPDTVEGGDDDAQGVIDARIGKRVVTTRSWGQLYQTVHGSIAGTPNYMAPEQARGEARQVGSWSDVYSLGGLLYEILADRAPYEGATTEAVMQALLHGPPPAPYPRFQRPGGTSPEDGLRTICARAMAREIEDRYVDAGHLARAVSRWLDSASARDRAITLVQRADQIEPELLELRKRAATLRARAASTLARLPPDAPDRDKRPAWDQEDEAVELERDFTRKQTRYVELLRAALEVVPDLPQAHARLRGIEEPSRGVGEGWLTVVSEPPGASLTVQRFESRGRRLVAMPFAHGRRDLATPLEGFSLPVGSYHLVLEAPDRDPLIVLARVERGEVWSTVPAGTTRPRAVRLPAKGADPTDAVRIPAGWSWFGGDIESSDSLPRSRAWLEAYLIQRHPVTNRAYLKFLRELVTTGQHREARTYAPGRWLDRQGEIVVPDGELADAPVRRVTFDAAQAYARWWSRQTGQRWRLPREREWEKAARGVDERLFPWGNHMETSWACVGSSHEDRRPAPVPVGWFPEDVSPWGVRGLGGNVRDWVIGDSAPRSGPVPSAYRLVRGGHYYGIPQFARCALRYALPTPADRGVGFRLVCPLGEAPPTAAVMDEITDHDG